VRNFALGLIALAGCIDEYQGSNVQIDFGPAMPVQASAYAPAPGPGELPSNIHFTLYAFSDGVAADGTPVGRLFELQRFEIHRIVDLRSPCFIDVGDNVPFPGLHVSQFADMVEAKAGSDDIDIGTAMQRQRNVDALASDMGLKAVTSASTTGYTGIAPDCVDTSRIPPPACVDADSNRRRLAMCEESWDADGTYFEGTDRVLTAPLNGTTHGMVTGLNPVNLAPVGGSQFFVDEALDDFDGFGVYYQDDGAPDDELGTQLLFGKPTAPTRGVIHVHMTSLVSPGLAADIAIFSAIDEDDVHF
jgi:hypothetical protein